MKLGIIFDTEMEAKNWDWEHNTLSGSITKYKYNRVPLNQTTKLTKAKYAELLGIPKKIQDDEGNETDNPRYTELSGVTLDKYALVVGNDFAIRDEDGNITGHSEDVVDVSGMLKVETEGEL